MSQPATVGIVSPGAMGSAFARVLSAGGARVVATVAGRSERTRKLAASAEIELLADLAAVVRAADVVLSIVPPDRAEGVATSLAWAAEATGAQPLVVDANAISPRTASRIETELRRHGLDLVDASISGPPPQPGRRTRLYVSGGRADELLALPLGEVDARIVGDRVGAASAVKMCTASVYKGTVALLAHALVTARAHGVVDEVLADLETSFPGVGARVAGQVALAATTSGRYVGEMREIAATQAAAGLPAELFEAMATVYAQVAQRPLARLAPEDVDPRLRLEDVLDRLAEDPS